MFLLVGVSAKDSDAAETMVIRVDKMYLPIFIA